MALSTLSTAFAVLIIVFALCDWAAAAFRRLRFCLKHHCEAMPRGCLDPFLGIDRFLKLAASAQEKRYLIFSRQSFERYGATYTCKLLHRTQIHTADPENFKAVLSTQFDDYDTGARRSKAFKPLGGTESVFTTDGQRWKHARSVLRPGLAQRHAIDFNALEIHWSRLFKLIPKDGTTTDLQDLFFRFSMDSTTQFLFGLPLGCLENEIQPSEFIELVNSFEKAANGGHRRYILGSLVFLDRSYSGAAERQYIAKTRAYVDGMISQAMTKYNENKASKLDEDTEKHKSLFEMLVNTTSPLALRDHIMTTLGAARDTTASFLSQLWFEVSRRPEIFLKMKSEVDFVFNGQLPSSDTLKKLTYINQVMNETLRLYPPAPTTQRIANKDTTLPRGGGPTGNSPVFIQKGSEILLSFNALHRRRDVWGDNADDFVPERWSTIDPEWSFLPFSGGPRICPGQRRSLAECAYITVRLLQSISRIESKDDRPFEEFLMISVKNGHGCLVGAYVE